MTNFNITSNFIFGASERELITISFAEIIAGLVADYKSFSKGNEAGISIPQNKCESRMGHSCILYAEGVRLAHTHLELAKKLILASLFDYSDQIYYWLALKERAKKNENFNVLEAITSVHNTDTRGFEWLKANNEVELLETLLTAIKDFEDSKAKKREEEEKRKEALLNVTTDVVEAQKSNDYDLDRFLVAQEHDYPYALEEMQNGRKEGHWIWYIFPQQKGLGHSYNSEYYGLDGLDEAIAYVQHPVLGKRLREICQALLDNKGKDIQYIMGSSIDVIKLKTSMELFDLASPNDIFDKVLSTFY